MLIQDYDYFLPKNQIAKFPIYPKENAKLLVFNRKENLITHTIFKYFLDFIPLNTSIIINNTKVIKARIFGNKTTLGKIELLINRALGNNLYSVFIKGKVKIGTKILFENNLEATVIKLNIDGSRIIKLSQNNRDISFEELVNILDKIGHIPIPPYMEREDNIEDIKDYQTEFAKYVGAVASPTASLHFSKEHFQKMKNLYSVSELTLHIGAGTFKPVQVENMRDHIMHSEIFNIPIETEKIINSSNKILAIGTTVTRTIENYIRTKNINGDCGLFLNIENKPKRVNHLLTNFHLPKSTLIMLVSSFINQKKVLEIYKEAIKKNYRFFSYGDAMLII